MADNKPVKVTKTTLMINNINDLSKVDPALLTGAEIRIGPFGSVPASGSTVDLSGSTSGSSSGSTSGSGSGSGSGSSPFSGCPTNPGSGPTLTFLPDASGDPATCVDPSAEPLHGPTTIWVVTNVCPIFADDTDTSGSGGGEGGSCCYTDEMAGVVVANALTSFVPRYISYLRYGVD